MADGMPHSSEREKASRDAFRDLSGRKTRAGQQGYRQRCEFWLGKSPQSRQSYYAKRPCPSFTMIGMGAFAEHTETLPRSAPRARAQDRACISSASRCSNFNDGCALRTPHPAERSRLGTCTRDPIGYEAGSNSVYEYCHSATTKYIDPWGEQIIPMHPYDPSVHSPGLPRSKPCIQFFIGYSPTKPQGNPSEDACARASGAKHVSICISDCKKGGGMRTGHHGFGGATRCGLEEAKYCELTQARAGTMGDGSGKSCMNATASDIARCVATIPEPTAPFDDFFNNCHQDVRNRATKCCLNYAHCIHVMPSCFF